MANNTSRTILGKWLVMDEKEIQEVANLGDYFGPNLEILRKVGGFSRQQLLDVLRDYWGITMHATTLRRIESGEQQPKLLEAIALADFFRRDVRSLAMRPLDEAEAEYFRVLDELVHKTERAYWSAREFRDAYGIARRLVASLDVGTIRMTPVIQKIQDMLERHKKDDELARNLIQKWNRS